MSDRFINHARMRLSERYDIHVGPDQWPAVVASFVDQILNGKALFTGYRDSHSGGPRLEVWACDCQNKVVAVLFARQGFKIVSVLPPANRRNGTHRHQAPKRRHRLKE